MALYFFNIRNGDHFIPDEEGSDLNNDNEAREEALASIRDIAVNLIRRGERVTDLYIEITDETKALADTVSGREVTH